MPTGEGEPVPREDGEEAGRCRNPGGRVLTRTGELWGEWNMLSRSAFSACGSATVLPCFQWVQDGLRLAQVSSQNDQSSKPSCPTEGALANWDGFLGSASVLII